MKRFLSAYNIKLYTIDINDGYISRCKNFLGKQYIKEHIKTLFRFKIKIGKYVRYYYCSLWGFHLGLDYNAKAIAHLSMHYKLLPLFANYPKEDWPEEFSDPGVKELNDKQIYCYYDNAQKGLLYVGDLSGGIKMLNMGLSQFDTSDGLIDDFPNSRVASVAYCDKRKSWAGWSHRAYYEFKVGHRIKFGDMVLSNPFVSGCDLYTQWEEMLKKHEIRPGWTANTLEDCKLLAKIFAQSVC